jgi:8-oxo-dGTP diphosphatase
MVVPHGRIPVVCAVIERGVAVLAARRRAGQTNGGLWEFPGGKVRGGESLAAALSREIREELDVTVILHRELPPVVWEYSWISIELLPFVCSIADGDEPRPLDHAELRFVTPAQARLLEWAPADRVVAEGYFGSVVSNNGNG